MEWSLGVAVWLQTSLQKQPKCSERCRSPAEYANLQIPCKSRWNRRGRVAGAARAE